MDYIQYDTSVVVCCLIAIIILFFIKFILKTGWSESIFLVFVISAERSRYLYDVYDFNSPYLGALKYLFMLYFCYALMVNIKKRQKMQFYVFIFLGLIYCGITLILKNNILHVIPDFIRFFAIFLLPYTIAVAIPRRNIKRALDLYMGYVIAYPFIILILLLMGRFNYYFGSIYIIYDSILVLNLGVLLLTKSQKIGRLTKVIISCMYLLIVMLAPTTGNFIIIIIYGLILGYKLAMKMRGVLSIALKITILIIVFSLILAYIQLDELNSDNPMLNLKVKQLIALKSIDNFNELPHSLRVRVKEVQLLFNKPLPLLVIGSGYGGVITDDGEIKGLKETDYSIEEIEKKQYSNLHFFISNIILKYGIVGLIIITIHYITFYKNTRNTQFGLLIVSYVLQSFWGLKMLLIVSFVYAFFIFQKEECCDTVEVVH